MGKFEEIGKKIGETVDKKQLAYGDSIRGTNELIRILYPEAITKDAYPNLLLIVRIIDKIKRIVADPKAFGEEPFLDIAGYALLGYEQAKRMEAEERDKENDSARDPE